MCGFFPLNIFSTIWLKAKTKRNKLVDLFRSNMYLWNWLLEYLIRVAFITTALFTSQKSFPSYCGKNTSIKWMKTYFFAIRRLTRKRKVFCKNRSNYTYFTFVRNPPLPSRTVRAICFLSLSLYIYIYIYLSFFFLSCSLSFSLYLCANNLWYGLFVLNYSHQISIRNFPLTMCFNILYLLLIHQLDHVHPSILLGSVRKPLLKSFVSLTLVIYLAVDSHWSQYQ